jgi:hypothetical protein
VARVRLGVPTARAPTSAVSRGAAFAGAAASQQSTGAEETTVDSVGAAIEPNAPDDADSSLDDLDEEH